MSQSSDIQLELFQSFSQPVVLAEEGTVTYVNRAAASFGIAPGMAAENVVEQAPDGSFALRLGNVQAQAEGHPYRDGTLYIADQSWSGARLTPDTLLGVAEAIRTPLTNLFSVSSPMFLTLEEMEDPAISRAMASINRSFYQLLHLMCNLSDAPAAVGGRLCVVREKLELCAFMQEIFDKAESLCKAGGHTLTLRLPDRTLHIWADRSRLARAVYNLIANAAKYTPEQSVIHLTLSRTDRFAVIEIRDDGNASDRLNGTFESFACQPSAQATGASAGFGLAIVRAVARAHDGTFVMGAGSGGGTAAALSLSLRAPDKQTQELHASMAKFDYTGGYRQELVELADILPADVFDTVNVN